MPQRMTYPGGVKRCIRCGVEKPLSDFYAVKARNGAPTGRCKACVAEQKPPYKRTVVVEPRACEHCGTAFTPKKRADIAKYCSRRCLQTAWSRAQGITPLRRIEIVDGRKRCTRCDEWKPLDHFGRRSDRGMVPLSECKVCASKRMCDYVRGERGRHQRYARKYGVSIEWYERTLAAQSGLCAICRRPPDPERKNHPHLAIDHDHATGNPRGLLCFRCNSGLGHFADEADLLARAIEYLNTHRLG